MCSRLTATLQNILCSRLFLRLRIKYRITLAPDPNISTLSQMQFPRELDPTSMVLTASSAAEEISVTEAWPPTRYTQRASRTVGYLYPHSSWVLFASALCIRCFHNWYHRSSCYLTLFTASAYPQPEICRLSCRLIKEIMTLIAL